MRLRTKVLATATAAAAALALSASSASAQPTPTMPDFLTVWVTDIADYWATVLEVTPTVQYYWPAPGESVTAGCENVPSHDDSAFYCPETDILVFSQDLAVRIWNGQFAITPGLEGEAAGDFGVAYVLAHEYAHNVQAELGILGRGLPIINTELHADCWAGIWGNAKYHSGQLEAGDVEEAVYTAARVGSNDWTNPTFHGTPEQRAAAFMYGYNSGVPGACDAVLNGTY